MNAIATKQETAVTSGILDQPVQMREAWKLLQAEHSNSKDITPDKWRLLAVAFSSVPDDMLTMAVLMHMKDSPYFPRLSDINKQLEALTQKTAFDVFREQMGRIKYKLVSDENGTAVFSNGVQEAIVRH